jgi:hypothetical protein
MGLTCSFNPVGLSAAKAQAVPTAHHSAKGELVLTGRDTAEVLKAAEGRLDTPPFLVAALVVADLPLAGTGAGHDWRDTPSPQVGAQPVGVVALVGDRLIGSSRRSPKPPGRPP